MSSFIPPIPIGQFTPSYEAISSWLYEIWKYLQANPIETKAEISEDIAGQLPGAIGDYISENPIGVQSVNGETGDVSITYADLVEGTTYPIYRAANDEIGQNDLQTAYNEGCRICCVDDTNCFLMLKELDPITGGETGNISLIPIGSGGGGGGAGAISSINGSIYPDANGNAVVNATNLPLSSSDSRTIADRFASTANIIDCLQAVYPVGAIYISALATNPGTLLGFGTWAQIKDRFLLAVGDTNTTALATGGEATHVLTAAEMPAHTHTGNTDTDGIHNHIARASQNCNSGSNRNSLNSGGENQLQVVNVSGDTTSAHSHHFETDSTGNGDAHNNMPPYLTVYMWRRTA